MRGSSVFAEGSGIAEHLTALLGIEQSQLREAKVVTDAKANFAPF